MPVVFTNKKLQKKKKCTSHSDSGANVIIKENIRFLTLIKKCTPVLLSCLHMWCKSQGQFKICFVCKQNKLAQNNLKYFFSYFKKKYKLQQSKNKCHCFKYIISLI